MSKPRPADTRDQVSTSASYLSRFDYWVECCFPTGRREFTVIERLEVSLFIHDSTSLSVMRITNPTSQGSSLWNYPSLLMSFPFIGPRRPHVRQTGEPY